MAGPNHPRKFTEEFRRQIVQLYLAGKPRRVCGQIKADTFGSGFPAIYAKTCRPSLSMPNLIGALSSQSERQKGNDRHAHHQFYTPAAKRWLLHLGYRQNERRLARYGLQVPKRRRLLANPPIKRPSASKLDPFKPIIDQWLEEDARTWRKQRHTARKIRQRLKGEYGADIAETTVNRYVRQKKQESRSASNQFLDLVWEPEQAQADFEEAEFYVMGVRCRLSCFVLAFPYSNVGIAQVFPGESAECVCRALKNVFEYIGGVPTRILFENATGVGRRVCEDVRTTELFGRFSAHYGFSYSFCNPASGHEKGNVENKVDFIRRNLFVPLPQITNIDIFNKRLLDKCMALSRKSHWIKNESEEQLLIEDRFALLGLPGKAFSVVSYMKAKANKKARFG